MNNAEKGGCPVSTGIPDLDHWIGDFRAGELMVIGSCPEWVVHPWPSKSRANTPWTTGTGCPFSSSHWRWASEVADRLLSMESGVDIHRLRAVAALGHADLTRLGRAYRELTSEKWARICVLPPLGMPSNSEFDDILKSILDRHFPFQMLVVDPLQGLYTPSGRSAHEFLAQTMTLLKRFSTVAQARVIATSDASRACEAREWRMPLLSDLSESSSIEPRRI